MGVIVFIFSFYDMILHIILISDISSTFSMTKELIQAPFYPISLCLRYVRENMMLDVAQGKFVLVQYDG